MHYRSNNLKNLLHGLFLALALATAEPTTTLPLIVHHFGGGEVLVGLFTSLLKGGAVVVQLVAAFWAQSFTYMMPYLKRVFLARFLSWLTIGVAILLLGERDGRLTLTAIGLGLFIFSFSAGFGSIYFNEIVAKIFTHEERGRSMANRQFAAALGSIAGGLITGALLSHFPPPEGYGYLFIVSSLLMAIGLAAFSTIQEPPKRETRTRERSFTSFLTNVVTLLKEDRRLQLQIGVVLLSSSPLLSLPFIILQANSLIELSGWLIGGFVTIKMGGALLGNLLYRTLTPNYRLIMEISFLLAMGGYLILLLGGERELHFIISFFLLGMALDGFRLASLNLLLLIAPERERPIYVALQNTVASVALFLPIVGGALLKFSTYGALYTLTTLFLSLGLLLSFRLPR
ncbi:MAG: MFS transporter [Epsilonproteobacteria bacterium]|nr:MFS transporter [Campylobacterota bacterium]NPA56608.1 MFS transporter [Campylobacterota bacterium]